MEAISSEPSESENEVVGVAVGPIKGGKQKKKKRYTANKKKCAAEKKRSLGLLYKISQACRRTGQQVASTGMFGTVYNNINMMIRVFEQILGRKSK